jgi:hypothetical protein
MIERPVRRYALLDAGSLTTLFRSGDVFKESGDDFSDLTKLNNFVENNLRNPSVYVMGVDPRWEAFIFSPMHNTTTYILHIVVRQDRRDNTVPERIALAAKHIFTHTNCLSLVGFVRESNRRMCMLSTFCGMNRKGILHGSQLWNNEPVNEVIYQGTIADFNNRWGKKLGEI